MSSLERQGSAVQDMRTTLKLVDIDHIHNSSYKFVQKVKLNLNDNPNIFSEKIELQENGGGRGIQTQIPNWPIYIGIDP